MNLFLVRRMESRELVGLIYCRRAEDLFDFVDECTDPYRCEYRVIDVAGSILWLGQAAQVPTLTKGVYNPHGDLDDVVSVDDAGQEQDRPDLLAGASLSELWRDYFTRRVDYEDDQDNQWLPVPTDDADDLPKDTARALGWQRPHDASGQAATGLRKWEITALFPDGREIKRIEWAKRLEGACEKVRHKVMKEYNIEGVHCFGKEAG
ncbi:hypothetical protein [Mesorhizobium sp. ESP-6-2]|uniref:hypothetical protein n=1 Tax=Mesorhizobium sp. ESP-6-2 TaxID=2876625 RepID=UPI001CD03345|nr:hypothetical protein [Mesorhizobium sp. ESP-6-2]MBZ9806950.1 hypothetical protein [Mesorhizobium sp. ESP-6-2]